MTMVGYSSPRVQAPDTLASALIAATKELMACEVPSPRHDAETIAAHLLGTERADLWRHLKRSVPTGFTDFVNRRCQRIPLQHLTGVAYFRRVSLSIGPGVFIPRPETEVVVEAALAHLDECASREPVVVDLCSGSGAIAISIATERPEAVVHAVEVDPGALPWLRSNTAASSVRVHNADAAGCLTQLDGQVDVVIANPPYVPSDAVPRDVEVARYDPAAALYSGVDGLDHIRMVERTAHRLLRPDGWVVVEHGDLQGASAPGVFVDTGWSSVEDHVDLSGRDRYVTARRSRVS